MNSPAKIFIPILFLFASFVQAQDLPPKADSTSGSTITLYNISGENLFFPQEHSFRITPGDNFSIMELPGINDSSTIWLRTRMAMMNNGFGFREKPANVSDMLRPYLYFYKESKNISLLRQVLGMAQLGAVGYIAYKHIKKYGLFHSP